MKSVYRIQLLIHHYLGFFFYFFLEFVPLIISSKEISASQRLKCSLDIFLLVGILFNNSSMADLETFHLV